MFFVPVDRAGVDLGDQHASEQDWPSFEPEHTFHNTLRSVSGWQQAVRDTLRRMGVLG